MPQQLQHQPPLPPPLPHNVMDTHAGERDEDEDDEAPPGFEVGRCRLTVSDPCCEHLLL